MDVLTVVHWVIITVKVKMGEEVLESIKWDGLPWDVRMKWAWYFKYRAALFQVKYPRYEVEMRWGNRPMNDTEEHLKERHRLNVIIAKKRKITEIENKLKFGRDNWDQLLPIEEDVYYKKAVAKLESLKCELKNLTNE